MARLSKEIGWNCIQGCKEYGVETENPEEIERLVKEWKADA